MKRIAIALAAVLMGGSAAAQVTAGAADFARFDARTAPDLPTKFAICDAARFLRTDPDLKADRILVRRSRENRFDLLIGPYFVGGPEWYDEDLERAYRRLRSAGQVDFKAVQTARAEIGRDMVRTFDRVNGAERAFLNDQSRYCEEVEDLGRRS